MSFCSLTSKYYRHVEYALPVFLHLAYRLGSQPGEAHTSGAVITPVRRSTRRSHAHLPSMLQDHDVVVDTLGDLEEASRAAAIFVPNHALCHEEGETPAT